MTRLLAILSLIVLFALPAGSRPEWEEVFPTTTVTQAGGLVNVDFPAKSSRAIISVQTSGLVNTPSLQIFPGTLATSTTVYALCTVTAVTTATWTHIWVGSEGTQEGGITQVCDTPFGGNARIGLLVTGASAEIDVKIVVNWLD